MKRTVSDDRSQKTKERSFEILLDESEIRERIKRILRSASPEREGNSRLIDKILRVLQRVEWQFFFVVPLQIMADMENERDIRDLKRLEEWIFKAKHLSDVLLSSRTSAARGILAIIITESVRSSSTRPGVVRYFIERSLKEKGISLLGGPCFPGNGPGPRKRIPRSLYWFRNAIVS